MPALPGKSGTHEHGKRLASKTLTALSHGVLVRAQVVAPVGVRVGHLPRPEVPPEAALVALGRVTACEQLSALQTDRQDTRDVPLLRVAERLDAPLVERVARLAERHEPELAEERRGVCDVSVTICSGRRGTH